MDLRAAVLGARVRAFGSIPCLLVEVTTVTGRTIPPDRSAPATQDLWLTMEGTIGPEDGGGAAFLGSDEREALQPSEDRLAALREHCLRTARIPVVSPVSASHVATAVKVVGGLHVPLWEGADDPEEVFAEIWDRIKPSEVAGR